MVCGFSLNFTLAIYLILYGCAYVCFWLVCVNLLIVKLEVDLELLYIPSNVLSLPVCCMCDSSVWKGLMGAQL